MDLVRNSRTRIGFLGVASLVLIALVFARELPIAVLPPILGGIWMPVFAANAQGKPVRRPALLLATAALGTAVLVAITLYLVIN